MSSTAIPQLGRFQLIVDRPAHQDELTVKIALKQPMDQEALGRRLMRGNSRRHSVDRQRSNLSTRKIFPRARHSSMIAASSTEKPRKRRYLL